MMDDEIYVYGMRLRGFSIGAQPIDNLIGRMDDPTRRYHDLLEYSKPLTEKQMYEYDLDFLYKH